VRTSGNSVRAAVVGSLAGLVVAGWAAAAMAQPRAMPPGASVYKRAGCIVCHKWHGMGGPGYGGTPINFRATILNEKQLIEVIACGRPGTGMLRFLRGAYKDFDCYDGMTLEELGDMAPGPARQQLNYRQVKQVADFILNHFKGRSNELKKADCTLFFGKSKMCTQLKITAGGGGGGH
jgi:hypothetical protein